MTTDLPSRGATKQGIAARVRAALDELLRSYEEAGGCGPDAYHPEPTSHPMADAKYLETLATQAASVLITQNGLARKALPTLQRLEAQAVTAFGRRGAWGLGFSRKEAEASEPYLITTSLVFRGLAACQQAGVEAVILRDLIAKTNECLDDWAAELGLRVMPDGVRIPSYSPVVREPITNAAVEYLATRVVAGRQLSPEDQAAADSLWHARLPWVGWPYAPGNTVIDLLHQAYILNSFADLRGVPAIEQAAVELLGQFIGPGDSGYFDTMTFHTEPPLEVLSGPYVRRVRGVPGGYVGIQPKAARLWSLGELLVLWSRLAMLRGRDSSWARLAFGLAEGLLDRLAEPGDPETTYPRHTMHAAHGLACYLAMLRTAPAKA